MLTKKQETVKKELAKYIESCMELKQFRNPTPLDWYNVTLNSLTYVLERKKEIGFDGMIKFSVTMDGNYIKLSASNLFTAALLLGRIISPQTPGLDKLERYKFPDGFVVCYKNGETSFIPVKPAERVSINFSIDLEGNVKNA